MTDINFLSALGFEIGGIDPNASILKVIVKAMKSVFEHSLRGNSTVKGGLLDALIGGFGHGGLAEQLVVLAVRYVLDRKGLVEGDSLASQSIGMFIGSVIGFAVDQVTKNMREELIDNAKNEVKKEEGLLADSTEELTDPISPEGQAKLDAEIEAINKMTKKEVRAAWANKDEGFSDIALAKWREGKIREIEKGEGLYNEEGKRIEGKEISKKGKDDINAFNFMTAKTLEDEEDASFFLVKDGMVKDFADNSRKKDLYGMLIKGALSMGIAGLIDNAEGDIEGDRAGINQPNRLDLLTSRAIFYFSGALASGAAAVGFDTGNGVLGDETGVVDEDDCDGKACVFFSHVKDDLIKPFENLGIRGTLAGLNVRDENGNLTGNMSFAVGADGQLLTGEEGFAQGLENFNGLVNENLEMVGISAQRMIQLSKNNDAIEDSMRAANARVSDDDPDKLTEEELQKNIDFRIAQNIATTMDPTANFLGQYSLDIMNSRLGNMMITPDQSQFFAATEYTYTGLVSDEAKDTITDELGLNLRYLAREAVGNDEDGFKNVVYGMIESAVKSGEGAGHVKKGNLVGYASGGLGAYFENFGLVNRDYSNLTVDQKIALGAKRAKFGYKLKTGEFIALGEDGRFSLDDAYKGDIEVDGVSYNNKDFHDQFSIDQKTGEVTKKEDGTKVKITNDVIDGSSELVFGFDQGLLAEQGLNKRLNIDWGDVGDGISLFATRKQGPMGINADAWQAKRTLKEDSGYVQTTLLQAGGVVPEIYTVDAYGQKIYVSADKDGVLSSFYYEESGEGEKSKMKKVENTVDGKPINELFEINEEGKLAIKDTSGADQFDPVDRDKPFYMSTVGINATNPDGSKESDRLGSYSRDLEGGGLGWQMALKAFTPDGKAEQLAKIFDNESTVGEQATKDIEEALDGTAQEEALSDLALFKKVRANR